MENLTINNILKFYEKKDTFPETYTSLIIKWKTIKSMGKDNIYYILGEFPITLDTVINTAILKNSQNKFIENRQHKNNDKSKEILQNDIDEYTSFITIINSFILKDTCTYNSTTVLTNELRQALGSAVHFNLLPNSQDEEETITGCCPMWYTPTHTGAGKEYIFYDEMDDNNKKAMDIQATQGWDAAIKHMMTGSDGNPRSYAEMRELYG